MTEVEGRANDLHVERARRGSVAETLVAQDDLNGRHQTQRRGYRSLVQDETGIPSKRFDQSCMHMTMRKRYLPVGRPSSLRICLAAKSGLRKYVFGKSGAHLKVHIMRQPFL